MFQHAFHYSIVKVRLVNLLFFNLTIYQIAFFRTTCYIDGIRITGNEAAKGIERRLTFTAKKPYVDIKILSDVQSGETICGKIEIEEE